VEFLRSVPRNAQKRFPHLTLTEAVAATAESSIDRINAANVNAYLNKFAGALNWAEQEGFIDRNPARGLGVADPVKKRDKRLPFSTDQLQRIFHAPIYTGCLNDGAGYSRVGPNLPRRSRYWVPLIGLLSGLRLDEICQLDVADMVVLDDVLCFSVREGGINGGEGKRIKSSASERVVPVHAELCRLGFSAYVAECRRAGEAKVFPDVVVGSTGYRSKGFSQWFGRFLVSCGAKQPLTCFHSFRHNFRDGLRASGVSRDVSLALGGWARSSALSDVAEAYGSGFPAAILKTAVDAVDFTHAVRHLRAIEDCLTQ
jgi:integrase